MIDLRSDPRGKALRAIRDRLARWDGPPMDLIAARATIFGNASELPDWIAGGPLGPPADGELAGRSIIEDFGIKFISRRGEPFGPSPDGRREFERLAIVGPDPDAWPPLRRTLDDLARLVRPEIPRGYDSLAGWLSALTDRACSRRPEFSALAARPHPMPLEWSGDLAADFIRLEIVPDLAEASGRLLDALAPEPIAPETPEAPAADAPPPEAPERSEAKPEAEPRGTEPTPKPPSETAIQCYRLKFIRGDVSSQKAIAERVYGSELKQYQVSRDLKAVEAWIRAGNVLPDLNAPRPKTFAVDPTKLDKGPPQGGYARRKQR